MLNKKSSISLQKRTFKDYHTHYFPWLDFSHFLSADARQSELQNFFKRYGVISAIQEV